MDDKISQKWFVHGTEETFVRGYFFEKWDVSRGKITMSRGVQ